MNIPTPSEIRLHLCGEITVNKSPEVAAPASNNAGSVSLSGSVLDARTGNALPGMRVTALTASLSLGSGVSNTSGAFSISVVDSPQVRERLLGLQHLPDAALKFRVQTDQGNDLYTSPEFRLDRISFVVTLEVPLPAVRISTAAWAALGKALTDARVGRLSDALRLIRGGGLNADVLKRQAMLDQMEQAFLDPTGILRQTAGEIPSLQDLQDPEVVSDFRKKLGDHLRKDTKVSTAFSEMLGKAASFASLTAVDWTIDPAAFMSGDVSGAINKFSDQYRFGAGVGVRLPGPENDLTRYRDYLVAIWTKTASLVSYSVGDNLSVAEALQQLENRFHQNFTTHDTTPVKANQVLNGILVQILTSPTGKSFGFAVPAASIAPLGARTPRQYLDYLVGLTGVPGDELGLRYRLDFARTDAALSNPVQENIATLQGFFRDGFQSDPDPAHVDPDKHNQPMVPDVLQGKAPFFLYYDEWLRQQEPFYPENHLDVRQILPVDVAPDARSILANLAAGKYGAVEAPNVPVWKFCQDVIALWDKLQEGHAQFYKGEYPLALTAYQSAQGLALAAMEDNILQANPPSASYKFRRKLPLAGIKDIPEFMNPYELAAGGFTIPTNVAWAREHVAFRLAYYALFTIPVCLGDTQLALGNYPEAVFQYGEATRFEVAVARESDSGGYRPWYAENFRMYWHGDRPYSVLLNGSPAADNAPYPIVEDDAQYDAFYDTTWDNAVEAYASQWSLRIPVQAELKLFRLRQAGAMLEWADALYRMDDATSAAHARELYKGVMWLHGGYPPINPEWIKLPLLPPSFHAHAQNPSFTSQFARAQRGIYQIDNGFNYYGERDDVVPVLRYRPLKDTADRVATMARSAQTDLLQYTGQIEADIASRLQLSSFLQKAKLQSSMADDQIAIAQHDVQVAQDQVAVVQAAIKAKQDEISKADSLFGQISDAISGVSSLVKSIPDDTKSAVSSGVISESTGDALVGQGILGLGAGASVMTGIGIFAVVGYVTLSGMADADNKRTADLQTLTDKALPAAQAVVTARQHAVNIAQYQKQIAQADIDLAQALLTFDQNKVLNQDFWIQLARIARRLLRRYLELGARAAWLAERALAYEQDRTIRIVRMDYFPANLQGITGADLLQGDLAELDAVKIENIRRTVPVKRTMSLARDFPMAYGQLKKTGRCAFRTEEAVLRQAHPGTGAYRIRTVSGVIQQVNVVQPMRGILTNQGVSISEPDIPDQHVLVRPADSLPLSEFQIEKDMGVYGLPNETLLPFEGSAIETFWELNLPLAANTGGLDGLADILLTFDLFAEFAPEQYGADLAALPTTNRKWILMSAAQYAPKGLQDLIGAAASARLLFDFNLAKLPRQEKSRAIKNVAVAVAAATDLDFNANLTAATPPTSAVVDFKKGMAISSLQPNPALPALPASPLNAFASLDPAQGFTLSIGKAANPGVDFGQVKDIVLAVEYEASLV